jgi:hypothetical protein
MARGLAPWSFMLVATENHRGISKVLYDVGYLSVC